MAGLSDQSGFLHEISLTLAGFAIVSAILLPTQRHEKGPKNRPTIAGKIPFLPQEYFRPSRVCLRLAVPASSQIKEVER